MSTRSIRALLTATTLLLATASARADSPPARGAGAPASPGVVNINTATAPQLQLLPGIGETRARTILEFRQRRPFARVDDLLAVRGIGRATLRKLRPYLTTQGETTLNRRVTGAEAAPATPPAAASATSAAARR